MEPNTEGWSVTYQIWGWVGAAIAGAVMWVWRITPRRAEHEAHNREADRIADLVRQLDRAETNEDIGKLRAEIQTVLAAMREAIMHRIDQVDAELDKRVTDLERASIVAEERRRSRRNPEH